MKFDLLIKGGTIFDPSFRKERRLDIGVTGGRIATLGPELAESTAATVLDAKGKMVLPGFIDFHTHVYWGGTPLGVNPDVLAPSSGVTTWIDAGSAGAGNVAGLVHHIIERSRVTIRFFLHVSYVGLLPVGHTDLRFGELFDHRLADANACLREVERFNEYAVGIKVRLGHTSTGPHGMDALRVARSLGDASGLPVMVHIGDPPPLLSDVLPYLRHGDIVTHCFTPGLMGIVDRHGIILREVWNARERGVLFDVAHGAGSFSFRVAEAALSQGFLPDVISSDLHAYNVDGPTFDLPTTLTKFLAMGMGFDDVLACVTAKPAKILNDLAKGVLAEGADADLAVVQWDPKPMILGDSLGETREYSKRLQVDATISKGIVLPKIDGPVQGKWKPGLPPIDENMIRPRRT